jgi:hypothetical protein
VLRDGGDEGLEGLDLLPGIPGFLIPLFRVEILGRKIRRHRKNIA